MSESVDNLILDLLEWIGPGERPYLETMEAWRTSCPRLPVWEDATDLGFIERHHRPGGAEANFCGFNKGRFDRQIYCMPCQQRVAPLAKRGR